MALNKKEKERLPSTMKRSPAKAQDTYVHTLESAEETHGHGEAAHRIAFASLKHSFEKVGDHWEPKDKKAQATVKTRSAARPLARARRRPPKGSMRTPARLISSM